MSLDSVEDQALFHADQELNFPLLSDPDGSAAAKLGVLPEGARWTKRVTLVIDEKGILRAIDDQVQVATHGDDLVDLVQDLRS